MGFMTDVGALRVKQDINLGLYLGLTGQQVKARDLVSYGLATHFISRHKLPLLSSKL